MTVKIATNFQPSRRATAPRQAARLVLLGTMLLLVGCKTPPVSPPSPFSRFTGLSDFSCFARTNDDAGHMVLLSPTIPSPVPWNQLIVSWNAAAPKGTFLKIEAAGIRTTTRTRFYTLAQWSPDPQVFPRRSVPGQRDADGAVNTDTLALNKPASAAQVRVTLGGTNGAAPELKLLGLAFSDTTAAIPDRRPNRRAWGRTVATPERSQFGYAGENGWCSPASLCMVLAHWAEILNRPELNLTVPQVAAAVYDPEYPGTGNWPFNTAFAGSFAGLRSYVTRFDDLSEVEDWTAAGIPVILSARWDLLQPGRPADSEGHLIVCIGFTKDGDVVANDPATHPARGETVRRTYHRTDVIRAWAASHNTVYLVYPVAARIPRNSIGQW